MLAMSLCLDLNGLIGLLLYVPVNRYGHVGMFLLDKLVQVVNLNFVHIRVLLESAEAIGMIS